jgi:hypothetical protein
MFNAYKCDLTYLKSLCLGFGSSVADTSIGGGLTPANTLYYHPVTGLDTNSGLTPALAKKTLPFSPAGNTKHLIASGTTISLGDNAANFFNTSNADNVVLSVYDSIASSPTFGQEITNQPNPFIRALACSWITDAEKAKYYFTIDGGSLPNSASLTRGFNIDNGTYRKSVIRGAVIKNCTYTAISLKNANLRLEDCVIDTIQAVPTPTNNYYGGVGVRSDTTGLLDAARLWISNIGEDALWLGSSSNHKVVDSAIKHTCNQQKYGVQHCDAIQFNAYPANFVLRRLAILHLVQESPMLNSGSGEITAGGAVVVSTGTAGTDTPGGLMEDVIYVTNYQGTYFQQQSGVTKRRCIEYIVNKNIPPQTDLVTWQKTNNVEDSCVLAKQSLVTTNTRVLMSAATSNFSNSVEVTV